MSNRYEVHKYYYKTYPKERTAVFYSIISYKNTVIISQGKKCELWECSEVSRLDYLGNQIWNTEFDNTDVGGSTILLLKDTLYVGGNYNPDQAKSVINRMNTDGKKIDEHIYSDPLNRFTRSLINHLYCDNKVLYFTGGSYNDNWGKALIYCIDKSMDLNICYVDSTHDNSVVWDANIGPDSLLTCFIMENRFGVPRDRRRIEKYDSDLNLVWKYSPPDSLLLSNNIYFHGTVLDDGNIFFTYRNVDQFKHLPNLRTIDTISKKTLWEYDFPDIASHNREIFKSKQLKNGDILITGQYTTKATVPRIDRSPWLMRLDRNGNKKWEKAFVEIAPDGDDKTGTLWDAIELDNGDIMACGYVSNNNKWDPLLIRTDADGCINQGQANCPTVQIIDLMSGAVDEIGEATFSIHPNPASTTIYLSTYAEPSAYELYSITGQLVLSGFLDARREIDISSLPSAMYILKATDINGKVGVARWVKD